MGQMWPAKSKPAPDDNQSDWYAVAKRQLGRLPAPSSLEEAARLRNANQILSFICETLDIEPPKIWVDTISAKAGNPLAINICFWNGPDQSLGFAVFSRRVQIVRWRAKENTVILSYWRCSADAAREAMDWLYPAKNRHTIEAIMELAGKVGQ
jgi:hypothetical protein